MEYASITELQGKTFDRVYDIGDEIIFKNENETFKMCHYQDCCERVYIESIVGDLSDLEGVPLLMAEEVSNAKEPPKDLEYTPESYTWTFYKFRTIKGSVDIRWYGTSNGYYSEGVSITKVR